jgi:predicted PurR-regulated permease PerM
MYRRYDYGRRRTSNALWGVLIVAVVAVIAIVFLVNTTGNNAITASKNIPADTTTTGSNAPAPSTSTTGQSTER